MILDDFRLLIIIVKSKVVQVSGSLAFQKTSTLQAICCLPRLWGPIRNGRRRGGRSDLCLLRWRQKQANCSTSLHQLCIASQFCSYKLHMFVLACFHARVEREKEGDAYCSSSSSPQPPQAWNLECHKMPQPFPASLLCFSLLLCFFPFSAWLPLL